MNKKLTLSSGVEISYDKCLLATGGRPRNLPLFKEAPADVREKVSVYRTIPDYQKMDALVGKVGSVLVVGGGFLGSELAVGMASRGEREEGGRGREGGGREMERGKEGGRWREGRREGEGGREGGREREGERGGREGDGEGGREGERRESSGPCISMYICL